MFQDSFQRGVVSGEESHDGTGGVTELLLELASVGAEGVVGHVFNVAVKSAAFS